MTTQITNLNGEPPGWGYPTLSDAFDPFIKAHTFAPSRGPFIDATKPHPHKIAYRGYRPAPGAPRAYYRDGDNWRDTLTNAPWQP